MTSKRGKLYVIDEQLSCDDCCFTVSGKCYSVSFCLEGYKKHPNQIGFIKNGEGRAKLLHRMSSEEAIDWIKNCTKTEHEDIFARMNFTEMKIAFPNPGDRLVQSVLITKWQRKQVFDFRYSDIGYYGSEILFHVVPDTIYEDSDQISVLKLEEDCASFLLAILDEFYPYFSERYYLTENHVPAELWKRFTERVEEIRNQILSNPYCEELQPYIKKFDLCALADFQQEPERNDEIRDRIHSSPTDLLYEHRYEAAKLYDSFLRWSKAQLRYHNAVITGRMFNIQGP